MRTLRHWLGCITGIVAGRKTVRRLVKRLGFSFKKAKKLLGKANPQKRQELVQSLLQRMLERQQPEAPLLVFCDEAHLHLDTDLGWGWARRGQRLYVHSDTPSLSRKLTCFGSYALGAADPVRLFPASWANAETTCQMLDHLRDSYPDRPLVVIWDNVRYHHAVAVRSRAQELGIQL